MPDDRTDHRDTDPADPADPAAPPQLHTGRGPGRLLVAVYGLLALAATGRSVLQISEYFSRAPAAYVLSAVAALIYLVATIGLARGDRASVRLARIALSIELAGVLVVGAISYAAPEAFPDKTVWSHFGSGYGYVPLLLPVLGLWWIHHTRVADPAAPAAPAGAGSGGD